MTRITPILALLFLSTLGYGQHYYNDIISIQLSNQNYKLLKQANINMVKATSYEADNSLSENFLLEQQLSKDKKRLTTRATTTNNTATITNSYFENDRLLRTSDSLTGVKNISEYEYNAKGNLVKITTRGIDMQRSTGNTIEVHEWFYNQNGAPEYMLKIKNLYDTVRVDFLYDENGLVAEERWKRKGKLLDTYYYYYNSKNQLTDIVRFNTKVKKMLPDFIFRYDDNGNVAQMIQVIPSGNYLTWKYSYNENGLKQSEECYNKAKQLVGRVVYKYSK